MSRDPGVLGIEGLENFRHQNLGAKPLIDDDGQAQLWREARLPNPSSRQTSQVLPEKPPDGGLWNGCKVANWLSGITGQLISRQRGWEILPQMTFRRFFRDESFTPKETALRVPRPSHTQSDEVKRQAWKKTSNRSKYTPNYLPGIRNLIVVRHANIV